MVEKNCRHRARTNFIGKREKQRGRIPKNVVCLPTVSFRQSGIQVLEFSSHHRSSTIDRSQRTASRFAGSVKWSFLSVSIHCIFVSFNREKVSQDNRRRQFSSISLLTCILAFMLWKEWKFEIVFLPNLRKYRICKSVTACQSLILNSLFLENLFLIRLN